MTFELSIRNWTNTQLHLNLKQKMNQMQARTAMYTMYQLDPFQFLSGLWGNASNTFWLLSSDINHARRANNYNE